MKKLNCLILRTTTVVSLGVPIFRVITVSDVFDCPNLNSLLCFSTEVHLKDAEGMADSVDPDQTVLGLHCFFYQTCLKCLSQNLDSYGNQGMLPLILLACKHLCFAVIIGGIGG